MLLNSFKVGGYKVFGKPVELNMVPQTKNVQFLSENIIIKKDKGYIKKNLKSAIIYGGNNTGKSSLLDGLVVMKKIFNDGNVDKFPFDILKNFCYEFDDVIRFEISFLHETKTITYGFEFEDEKSIGEYLFVDEEQLFSRNLEGVLEEGALLEDKKFYERIIDLPTNKLIIPYIIEYSKAVEAYADFLLVNKFFSKIKFIDNRENYSELSLSMEFMNDNKKMTLLNKLISSTELYLEKRGVLSEEEVIKTGFYTLFSEPNSSEKMKNVDDKKDTAKYVIDFLRLTSYYKEKEGNVVAKPSLIFDSVGTNKFIVLSMHIITALLENNILLIDEFDSSLHHKLTRALVILMNSKINKKAQFILTSHDVKLLSPKLFRKDQINFILRDDCCVEVVTLDQFKANSDKDIRSSSNFEKMYTEEKIVSLPETDVYQVIKEFSSYE